MDALSSDCLRLILTRVVDPVCLASVSCVCKEWRVLSAEQWPARTKQWRFGWMGRWEALCAAGLHLQVFGERWQVDKQALACVRDLSLPCGREEALAWLRGMGSACLDVLLAAAYWPPSDNPNLQEALAAIQTVRAASELQDLMASNDPDLDCMERSLLCIAQTYSPEVDVSAFVLPFLDTLAREAYSRIRSQERCTNHQALEVVTHLVFGPRHPAYMLPLLVRALPLLGNAFFEAAAWLSHDAPAPSTQPLPEWKPPPGGFGLGLEAMRSTLEEPRNLSCMLMHEVLGKSGRGPPEILCVIHASVCQRVGLPVHLMRMPMRGLLNVMAAPASLTYRGCICTRPSGETDVGNSTLNAIEEAVDVFNRGNVKNWESVLSSLPPWAAEWPGPELVEPWEFIVRWCRDSWKRHLLPPADNAGLQRMATLVNAIHPDHDPMYVFRIKAALVLRDPGDAEAALQGLTAYVAAHPTLAYMADIPQFRREIQQLRQMLSVKKA